MIKVKEVRVIDAEGVQLGILDTREAIKKAEEAGLDLVEVAPTAKPPVCRIMDFGKYKYEQNKKDRKARSRQHQQQLHKANMLARRPDDHLPACCFSPDVNSNTEERQPHKANIRLSQSPPYLGEIDVFQRQVKHHTDEDHPESQADMWRAKDAEQFEKALAKLREVRADIPATSKMFTQQEERLQKLKDAAAKPPETPK